MDFIMIFIAIANIIAILLVYFSFGKKMEKQKRLFNTMIVVGLMYILVSFAYFMSSIGIKDYTGADTAKSMMTMAFVPVNTIIFMPFLIRSYINLKEDKIKANKFKTRAIVAVTIMVIAVVGEFFYFRHFQNNLVKLEEQAQSEENR